MISQSRTPAGILRTLTAILCLAAILMSVTGSSAWAAPRVVRVVGIQDGISDSQADYFRRTIAELNDLTEDRIFVTRPIPAASSLDLNAYQGLDFAIVSPRVFALLERYNGFIPMASLSVDIPDCEPGAELRPVVSALVFATPDADEDGLAKPHLSDIAGETVTVVKGDEVDTTFLLQNELSSRRLAPVKVRVASDGGTPSEIIRRAVERGDKLFAVSTDLLRETSSDLFSGFVKVDMRVDDETGLVSSVTPMPGRVFAAGLSVARMGLLEFAATLFALDIAPDIHWVRPADYRSVHLAAERMRDPVYMSYQKKTLLEEMREHAAWVILAAAILIGMIWHSVAAERLVRRRSAELMETVKRQQASERQFEALERMTAVSQMSNIVAHELRQPLAAVTNFAMGVRRRIANGTLTADSLEFALGRILAENERASDIVEHVRDYARKRRRQITPVDLTQMSAKVVSSMRASNARVSFESEVPAGLFVEGDSLEIELVLRNLVKNAGESAAQADGVPRVVLAGERIGDEVVITVTDNGPVRTKAEIDAFLVPLRSEKSGDAVTGVEGLLSGEPFRLTSRLGVVLAGGGFSRNMEMMRLYAPGLSDVLPALDEGADGSLIQAAADIGAALVGMSYFEVRLFASTLGLPGDPSDYILVNARGERFMREDRRRSTLAEAVVRQPDGMAWMVINAPGAEPLRPTTGFRETVIATISGYNDCIRTKERDSLGRDPLTMRPIGPGVEIRPVLPRILWSYGGLEINEKAEVIDRRGRPMKGLAAAGDITGGIHGEHALMGDMLASAAVFGRIAARTLVKNGRAVKRQD